MAEYRLSKASNEDNNAFRITAKPTSANSSTPAVNAEKDKAGDTGAAAPSAETTGNRINPGTVNVRNLMDLKPNDLLKSIIFSEVLGKPKCMRKARW